MARRFDGANDHCYFSAGGVSANGALTMATLVRRGSTAAGHWDMLLGMFKGSPDTAAIAAALEISASNYGAGKNNTPTFESTAFVDDGYGGTTINNTTDWFVVAVTKATGTSAPTMHVRNLTTAGAWTHDAMSETAGNAGATQGTWKISIGEYNGIDDFNGDMLVAAWWNSALSDANIEAFLTGTYTDWRDASVAPAAVWPVGQGSDATAAIPDDKGTSTWDSTAGTTMVADPGFWSWGASGTSVVATPGIILLNSGTHAVTRSGNLTATPGVLNLKAGTASPQVGDSVVGVPGIMALTAGTAAVTRTGNVAATPGTLALNAGTAAVTRTGNVTATPGIILLTVGTHSASVTAGATVSGTPGVLMLKVGTHAPTYSGNLSATPGVLNLTVGTHSVSAGAQAPSDVLSTNTWLVALRRKGML